ncbi:SAM-dependent methyltransferase [Arthrobacter sp. V4I6]|uniref:class I SAM-dependent methyltransferase n=1 Tax=unclassified Arthrobacter TaxID=235627 RepID=UPI0027855BEA|nr:MULTISPECIES: class I SAM-dependent methyltransferase [unclassified Arthrobacter]MDQ0820828.1 SAM-dependent methyltransferase [Arthrobacter sp. V1I7]MDQ0855090.1 SAM-dependent methyltransferase [Arthrobacter sp. V4I6]
MTVDQETSPVEFDAEASQAFAGRFVGILNDAAIALLTSVGHQTGLFETLAGLPAATSEQIADAGDLDERYVREWLGGMTAARVVRYDSAAGTYWLPPEHAAVLTRAAGPDNMAILMQHISMMGEVEQKIIERFRHGSGLSYADYPHFHKNMAETSAAVHDAALLDVILPLAPGLPGRLKAGIDVADFGCGSGHAINLMAQAFPASRFTGYDFSERAVLTARAEAERMGLANAGFEVADVARLDVEACFDAVTAFDAIHDQAHPAAVLRNVRRALRPGGIFLMVDIKASSKVEDNLDIPWGSYLYAISTFHCMSVSLGLDGDGLGTVWGEQLALSMLADAGFGNVESREIDSDPFNAYFIAKK